MGTRLIALALVLLGACTPASIGSARRPVINGALDPAHPEVGLLSTQGDPSCTATLVGSRTLLTAAHCLSDDEKAPYTLLDPIVVELGGKSYSVASATIHATYSGWSLSGDVGVARLAQAVVGITPALLARDAPKQGEPIVVVGFGCSTTGPGSSKTFGVKRKGDAAIESVSSAELGYPIGTTLVSLCEGDSGGPSFATRGGVEQLVGVHSYDLDTQSFDQRADAFRGWIEQEAQGDLYQGPPPAREAGPGDTFALEPGSPKADAASEAPPPAGDEGVPPTSGGGGCSLGSTSAGAPSGMPLLLLFALAWRRVRRRA